MDSSSSSSRRRVSSSSASSSPSSDAIANWEKLFNALHERNNASSSSASTLGSSDSSATLGGFVPASLGQSSNINSILQVANEIQPEHPNVARIRKSS